MNLLRLTGICIPCIISKVLLLNLLTIMSSWRADPSNIRLMQFLLGCGQRISAVLEMRSWAITGFPIC